jgi:hypothetical protein
MKAGYKNFEVLKWNYQYRECNDLVGFQVHSKEILTPQISKIIVVDDLFSLSLLWVFELNKSSVHLPQLLYEINVNYLFSTEKFIEPNFPNLIINHSLKVASEEFNKQKLNTAFFNYELKIHIEKEQLSMLLFKYLEQTLVLV